MAYNIIDAEFGTIRVKRVHAAKHVRLRIDRDGTLVATIPRRAPLILIKNLLHSSRAQLRSLLQDHPTRNLTVYRDAQRIGCSHTLILQAKCVSQTQAKIIEQSIVVTFPQDTDAGSLDVQTVARQFITKALKKEATAFLPRRLTHLAELYGFRYTKVRYTNAKSRWGSCSSSGTISLNIALMNLPMEIIDYVLLHELSHTRQMNHSKEFWNLLESVCPDYKALRRSLKDYNPYL